ncbi:type II toxin-antitoxin system HicB family antitoxin [Methylomicrobium lacus]|uniref:type II toxin-antitoxin system HicB family antitoxin n=1 Tax=Methylomicrobium lacus TaxID=136992 RepID=UPI00045E5C1F|nr:type II toxin-antitoxin system HicB family antitoxin [Methylomicrobium lacus]
MKTKLVVIVQPTNKGLAKDFSAYCPDIPGSIAHGLTEEKALAALKETLAHQIQNIEDLGLEPPKHIRKVKILEVETIETERNVSHFAQLSRVH